jgi:hypothetical protein
MAIVNQDVLPIIRKAPKAFLGYARRHNELALLVRPVLNIKGGLKISVTQTAASTIISFRA